MKRMIRSVTLKFAAFAVLMAATALFLPSPTLSEEETSTKPVVEQSEQPDAVRDDDSASEAIESAKDATSAAIETAKRAILDAIDQAKRKASSALEAEKDATKEALDKAQEATRILDQASQATREVLDKAQKATEEVLEKAKEAVQQGDEADDGSSASTDPQQTE
jgi:Skp family chaperone for outer membrane proteins